MAIIYFGTIFMAFARAEFNEEFDKSKKTKWKLLILLLHPCAYYYLLRVEKDNKFKALGAFSVVVLIVLVALLSLGIIRV